jgi:WhiB family redox-sensing transcriptional regulator
MGSVPNMLPAWLGPLPMLPLAACRDSPTPDAWFSTNMGEMHAAQRVCHGCPERAACLAFALAEHIGEGVWGGTLPGERGMPAHRRRAAS